MLGAESTPCSQHLACVRSQMASGAAAGREDAGGPGDARAGGTAEAAPHPLHPSRVARSAGSEGVKLTLFRLYIMHTLFS